MTSKIAAAVQCSQEYKIHQENRITPERNSRWPDMFISRKAISKQKALWTTRKTNKRKRNIIS